MIATSRLLPAARDVVAMHWALIAILVFQNLFNTFSPYLTLAINISTLLMMLIRYQPRYIAPAPIIIASVYAVLVWVLFISAYRGDASNQIILKYFRTALAVSMFSLILGSYRFTAPSIVKAINLAFGFHIILVMMQLAFPNLITITAPIFGFELDMNIHEQYKLRKLGATSSYDTASLLSVAALIFFHLQFLQGKGAKYFLMATIAFVATFMSSRTGMAVSLSIVTLLCLHAVVRARLIWKIVIVLSLAALLASTYIILMPLFFQTLGFSDLKADDVGFIFAASDYGTTGTLEALTADHLEPLNQPLLGLLLGFAVDPNAIGRYTDIGYVKLIYHIGIVGTLVVLFVHLYMLFATYRFIRRSKFNSDRALIARFLFTFIAMTLAFNYKSLEIHSRGTGDFIYMLFLYLASSRVTINSGSIKLRNNS